MRRHGVLIVMLVGLTTLLGTARSGSGQVRGRRTFSTVSVGSLNTSATSFRSRSSGVGNLGGYQAPRGILGSSIHRNAMTRQPTQPTGRSRSVDMQITGTRTTASHSQRYTSATPGGDYTASLRKRVAANKVISPGVDIESGILAPSEIRGAGDWRKRALETGQSASAVSSAEAYLAALGGQPAANLSTAEKIDSLVPEIPGRYRDYMLQAEKAFHQRRLREAARYYDMSGRLSGNSPESSLGQMLSYFAAASVSYRLPSYHLRRALTVFPELPLVAIHPRSLYDDSATYVQDLIRLERYVEENPADPDGHFLLGYLLWADGDTEAATASLRSALEHSTNPNLTEAIHTLWDGMLATGKVTGPLAPPEETSEEESP